MLVFLGSSRVMWLHYFGMIRVTLSESTDNLLLQTLEVLFLSFSYSRNWNLIYRCCLRASYRSEGRGERKQKRTFPDHLPPTPRPSHHPLYHSPLEVDLKTVCCIDFYPYTSRPDYCEEICHSNFKICGRTLACSKRSDSGERCEVKKAMKSRPFFYFSLSFLNRNAPHYLNAWNRLDELLWCDHSSETSSADPHGTAYLVRCSDVWVLGWNPTVTIRMKPLQQYFPMVLFI